jgi:hypothetical protein
LGNSGEAKIIVGAIVNLGHGLKLELIAEGIDTVFPMFGSVLTALAVRAKLAWVFL